MCKGSCRGATEGLFYDKVLILQSLRHFLTKMPPPFTQGRLMYTILSAIEVLRGYYLLAVGEDSILPRCAAQKEPSPAGKGDRLRWMRRKELLAIEALCGFIPCQHRETKGLPYGFEKILSKDNRRIIRLPSHFMVGETIGLPMALPNRSA